jgi:hypothetical protein
LLSKPDLPEVIFVFVVIFSLYSARGSPFKGGIDAYSIRSGSFSCVLPSGRRSWEGRDRREVWCDSWLIRSIKQSADIHWYCE